MFNRRLSAVLISTLSAGCAMNKPSPAQHYVAVSTVVSSLKPRVPSRDFSLNDSSDQGWQLALGRRFGQRWQLELSYTDAGSATLRSTPPPGQAPAPDVAVIYTASALNLAWQWRPHTSTHNAFVRAGVAVLDTHARLGSTKIPVDQLQDTQFVFGAGLEWRVHKGMRLRLAHDFYDRDASWSSLSLMIGLGSPKNTPRTDIQQFALSGLPPPIPAPDTAPASAQLSCRTRELTFHFANNSHKLLADDELKLYRLIRELDKHRPWDVNVEGHADAHGSNRANVRLSKHRVDAVLTRLLVLTDGSDNLRLKSRALGEIEPIASNRNPIGRARNRRVKITFSCAE